MSLFPPFSFEIIACDIYGYTLLILMRWIEGGGWFRHESHQRVTDICTASLVQANVLFHMILVVYTIW